MAGEIPRGGHEVVIPAPPKRFKLHHAEFPSGDTDTTLHDSVDELFGKLIIEISPGGLDWHELDALHEYVRKRDYVGWIRAYNAWNKLPNEYFMLEEYGVLLDATILNKVNPENPPRPKTAIVCEPDGKARLEPWPATAFLDDGLIFGQVYGQHHSQHQPSAPEPYAPLTIRTPVIRITGGTANDRKLLTNMVIRNRTKGVACVFSEDRPLTTREEFIYKTTGNVDLIILENVEIPAWWNMQFGAMS